MNGNASRGWSAARLEEAFSELLSSPATPDVSGELWNAFLDALETGEVTTVRMDGSGEWQAVPWVKAAILSGFRAGGVAEMEWPSGAGGFWDRPAFPPMAFNREMGVRIVPGGSSVRRGVYLAKGVVVMPPAYVNVGAWVGEGTMVDSHALVGSCAHIGAHVHLSAGAQIGGVLEPPQARPVVVEDGAFIGGLCGVFEGVVIRRNAVLAPGVILSRATKIYDLVHERELVGTVPEGAVVVPGARPASGSYAANAGIALQTPCIVKYRDEGTQASVALESALR